jgi:hypothetical protein
LIFFCQTFALLKKLERTALGEAEVAAWEHRDLREQLQGQGLSSQQQPLYQQQAHAAAAGGSSGAGASGAGAASGAVGGEDGAEEDV